MKKMLVVLATLALLAMSATSFAAINPYNPAQTNVPVTVTVEKIAEVYTNTSPVALSVKNFGSWGTAVERTVTVLTNVAAKISVSIDGTIAEDLRFWVLVKPQPLADWVEKPIIGSVADTSLLFTHTDMTPKQAFTAAAAAPGGASVPTPIAYTAESSYAATLPNTYNFTVVWSISE